MPFDVPDDVFELIGLSLCVDERGSPSPVSPRTVKRPTNPVAMAFSAAEDTRPPSPTGVAAKRPRLRSGGGGLLACAGQLGAGSAGGRGGSIPSKHEVSPVHNCAFSSQRQRDGIAEPRPLLASESGAKRGQREESGDSADDTATPAPPVLGLGFHGSRSQPQQPQPQRTHRLWEADSRMSAWVPSAAEQQQEQQQPQHPLWLRSRPLSSSAASPSNATRHATREAALPADTPSDMSGAGERLRFSAAAVAGTSPGGESHGLGGALGGTLGGATFSTASPGSPFVSSSCEHELPQMAMDIPASECASPVAIATNSISRNLRLGPPIPHGGSAPHVGTLLPPSMVAGYGGNSTATALLIRPDARSPLEQWSSHCPAATTVWQLGEGRPTAGLWDTTPAP